MQNVKIQSPEQETASDEVEEFCPSCAHRAGHDAGWDAGWDAGRLDAAYELGKLHGAIEADQRTEAEDVTRDRDFVGLHRLLDEYADRVLESGPSQGALRIQRAASELRAAFAEL